MDNFKKIDIIKRFCFNNNIIYDSIIYLGRDRYILENDNLIIKYAYKNDYFYYKDNEKEYNLLKELENKNIDFIDKQKAIDFYKSEKYSILVRQRVIGENFDLRNKDYNERLRLLNDIMEQFVILENYGYTYNDIWINNIIYNKQENKYVLIDLGSTSKNLKSLKDFKKSENYFNLADIVLLFIFILFNNIGYTEINTNIEDIKEKMIDDLFKKNNLETNEEKLSFLYKLVIDKNNYLKQFKNKIKSLVEFIQKNQIITYTNIKNILWS